MVKITAQVEGMHCGMCEAHVNGVVRRAFPVKKVSSSHARGETVIIAEQCIDDERLRLYVYLFGDAGYKVTSIIHEACEERGSIFSFLHRKAKER